MSIITSIFTVLFNNVLAQPPIFIGLLVVLGYALMKKKWYEIGAGFIRTVVGYMILQAGATLIKNAAQPMLDAIQAKWALEAVIIDPNFGLTAATAALESIGETASYAMMTLLIAFLWNILLVFFRKATKIRTLFTAGHIMVKQSTVATWIIFLLIPGMRNMTGVLMVGLLCGTYWSVFSNLTVEATQELTDNAGFAVGHQQMVGIWFAYRFAGLFKSKKEDKKEEKELNLGGFMSILDDYTVSVTLIMLLFFGIIMIIMGPEVMKSVDSSNYGSLSFPVYIIERCCAFTVALVILKTGVRMFVNEMVESFNGISSSVLKGALPAVDCAATLSFGEANASTLGFLFGAVGQLIAIAGLLIFKSPLLIIPGFVPLFYDNATIGLYAQMKGGRRGLVVCCIASGMLQVLGSAVAIILFQMGSFGGYVGNLDWATLWPLMGFIIKYLSVAGVVLCIVLMLVIPQLQYRRHKENYFNLGMEDD
ncbi:MAG: PTS transporter subunit IIC [Lachnospiraceae bacterium]|nr:PTS transporter subunit IIC [Lachnospiraceae bacterium]